MSHNLKYYRQKDVEGVSKISSFFKPNANVGDNEKYENPTESQIKEMPHWSLEEKIEAVTSSSEEPMHAGKCFKNIFVETIPTQRGRH